MFRASELKTYPIAIELTAWVELGINQYDITIDDISTLSLKRSEDVLHTRELSATEVDTLIEAIQMLEVPVLEYANTKSSHESYSYELIIESAHFSVEFNWENLDIEADKAESLQSVSRLAQLVEKLGLFQ